MSMLRLASSRVVRRAVRAIASPRILPGFITSAFSLDERESPDRSPLTDEKKLLDPYLVKVLKSEIKSKQFPQEKSIPADFPFSIEDDPCKKDVSLTREFDGEKIKVLVERLWRIPKDDDDANISYDESGGSGGADDSSSTDSDSDEEKETSDAPSVHLSVEITKENGRSLGLSISASADIIKIESMSVKQPDDDRWSHPTTYIVDGDGDLQGGLREYLKIRGIKKTTAAFLYEYMVRKSKQQPTLVLKDVMRFIKE